MTKIRTVNDNLEALTIDDIVNHKRITDEELHRDLFNLTSFSADHNANNFYGNPFLYHFQFANLLKCTRERAGRPRETIYDMWADPERRAHLISQTRKRNRGGRVPANNVFECYRINTGSIVMFKAVTAKYLYKKYSARSVLDPTAGWGGRMLAAWSLGIDYVGIDTNVAMAPAYQEMMAYLANRVTLGNDLFQISSPSRLRMIWQDALTVDFSEIPYDFVLTSPPYLNVELYQNMTPWKSKESFYLEFLLPLFNKCITHIKPGGHVCFNISPSMYDDALKFGLPICDIEEDLLQQLGKKMNKKKQDKIYIWINK